MTVTMSVSVAQGALKVMLVRRNRVRWAARAPYGDVSDLVALMGRLAAEAPERPRRVRIVLEGRTVQTRAITPAPPLRRRAVRRYVALEAARLFRRNGVPLVCDATLITRRDGARVLWAAAASEPLIEALLAGCAEAGLAVHAIGPAADVLPHALARPARDGEVLVDGDAAIEWLALDRSRVWRRRLLPRAPHQDGTAPPAWAASLAALDAEAAAFAAAYAAARRAPVLTLLPHGTRAARARHLRRRVVQVAALGATLWVAAGVVHVARLAAASHGARHELAVVGPAVDSVLALRRDLVRLRSALMTLARPDRERSRMLPLLADLTGALSDSTFLVTLAVEPSGVVRLAGYTPRAAQALAELGRVRALDDVRLEGVPSRERVTVDGVVREWDRFAAVARLEAAR